MQRISIERYTRDQSCTVDQHDGTAPEVRPLSDEFAGVIEGVRDDGSRWIMYLDAAGSPLVFWSARDETGMVVGQPISLQEDVTVEVDHTIETL